jgi:hypothetical protein
MHLQMHALCTSKTHACYSTADTVSAAAAGSPPPPAWSAAAAVLLAMLVWWGVLTWPLLLLLRRPLLLPLPLLQAMHILFNARPDLPGSRAVHPLDLLHTPRHPPATSSQTSSVTSLGCGPAATTVARPNADITLRAHPLLPHVLLQNCQEPTDHLGAAVRAPTTLAAHSANGLQHEQPQVCPQLL